eukprot:CAMPEP_0119541452 /NCGR_PEP_ID=MMETSP1344-20130328/52966_1 /TAXON_ID=236787 /ORGANISM="Florenciella parvula, Strain CCMP2471" /LENGTH=219 /DNA_ID=CAMNT_0007585429 /DNA_START=46 /DNA_END=702 /DNA_ORIENTATION=+
MAAMETSDESERSSHSSPSSSIASTENGESGGAPEGNKKALWSACGYGDLNIVKQYMIDYKAAGTLEDELRRVDVEFGGTPLHWACLNGHIKVVHVLLQAGAHPDHRDKHNATPLHLAADSGYTNVVQALIESGAALELQDDGGHTPLHIAALHGDLQLVQILLSTISDHPSDLDLEDLDAKTALQLAVESSHMAVANALKQAARQPPRAAAGETVRGE